VPIEHHDQHFADAREPSGYQLIQRFVPMISAVLSLE